MRPIRPLSSLVTALLAVTLVATDARAVPRPLGERELDRLASVVVEGDVVAVTLAGLEAGTSWSLRSYWADLRIRRVRKGPVKAGAVVRILWTAELWVGQGPPPDGRAPRPSYYPCEEVRVYLLEHKGSYLTAHWNGRTLLRAPAAWRLPVRPGEILRCAGGQPR
jgi:hypothetical protein